MSQLPVTIPKSPNLQPVEDFYRLRREGIGFIEQMGSAKWTDYNLHDPGITMLEALCYALTDLGYRTGWHILDLLTPETFGTDTHQPFFTAREIMTVNPWTTDDFRRLLIDLNGVRNAWMFCKECACDIVLYAWCDAKKQVHLGYQKPTDIPANQIVKVQPRGLYEALLELESDPELGDLNNRKINQKFTLPVAGKLEQYEMELRFPEWELLGQADYDTFVNSTDDPLTITLGKFSRSKTDNNTVATGELRQFWSGVFYVSFQVTFGTQTIDIQNATLRLFSNNAVKNTLTTADILAKLTEGSPTGFMQQYRRKLNATQLQIADAKAALQSHRNLDEDYCRVKRVDVEDVAVCADVEVSPGADIERVQAQIWFEIEQYFNPPVHFYALPELMAEGFPVEDIFNGPALNNGFIKQDELVAAGLKSVLRTSDIINRLMDIEGVLAVNNLLLTKYDAEGQIVRGAADIGLENYSPNKISAEWTLAVSSNHQPRLYHNFARFLFYKNGLPFLPRMDEAVDTLTQLRGAAERPKIKNAPTDLAIPQGEFRNPKDYFPVQYSLPRNYGISPIGLPGNAGVLRHAQARQLQGYLMVFEQLLVNAFAQTAQVGSLFALDPNIQHTYFTTLIDDNLIQDASDIFNTLTQSALDELVETETEFLERRNRFLDHILARFGEQFGEYALLLNNLDGSALAAKELISDKIGFLNAYPVISRDRARAMNYTGMPCAPEDLQPGLKRRINLLLGYPDLDFSWTVVGPAFGVYGVSFELKDANNTLWLSGNIAITATNTALVTTLAFEEIIAQMTNTNAYQITAVVGGFELTLHDLLGNLLATYPTLFSTKSAAESMLKELAAWAGQRRAIIVEHLLLRPKFPGDALFPVCAEGECSTCDADAYSFRLTFVMPGWNAPYKDNLDMRGFADQTIKLETPSHLLPKVCWVGNNGFVFDRCDPLIVKIAELLEAKGLTAGNVRPSSEEACNCALLIYGVYSPVFIQWFDDKKLKHFTQEALQFLLDIEFAAIDWSTISCNVVFTPALIAEINGIIIDYFVQVAFYGFQFEKFEDAWCAWLDANAPFDWTELRLEDRIEALLNAGATANTDKAAADTVCHCAAKILGDYGVKFHEWMNANIAQGKDWTEFGAVPDPVISACDGTMISLETQQNIKDLLVGTQENPGYYPKWVEVSYKLWLVLDLLGKLRNTYPKATLHDCDDGSDANPVRLNNTALGT
jgi:hypothetical protein